MAVIGAIQYLAMMVFGLFGGLIADALPKRTTIIATQTASMALALILFWLTWTHQVQAWHVAILARQAAGRAA